MKEQKLRTAGKPPSSSTQAFSTAISIWVPVALPGAHPGTGVAVLPTASQGHPKGWEPGLPAPRKPHSPAALDTIPCPALVSVTPLPAALPPCGTQPQPHSSVGQGRAGHSESRTWAQLGFQQQKLRGEEASPKASKPNRCVANTGCIYAAKSSCSAVSPTSFTRPPPALFAARLLKNFAQLQTLLERLGG